MPSQLTRAEVAVIAEAILARGLNLDRLAEAARLHPQSLQDIMQGRLRPAEHIRARLAEALGLDPARLGL